MGGVLRGRASVALLCCASIVPSACSSGPISVGDHRQPVAPPDGGNDAGRIVAPPGAFRDLCSFPRAVIVEDIVAEDTQVSEELLASLRTACATLLVERIVSQSDPGVLSSEGRPLWSPNELGLITGGPQIHAAARYLDMSDTPVYQQQTMPTYVWANRQTNGVILSLSLGAFTASHDAGVIQIAYEPIGGTYSLNVYGHELPGTRAAAYYFRTTVVPNLRTNTGRYYVVEWTDQDGNETPSAGDLFQVRAQG